MTLNVLLLDIEGTTTPISFVVDVLFPYAREHVATFLDQHFDDPDVRADRHALAALALEDLRNGVPGAAAVDAESVDDLVRNVHWQMDGDRKTTALKSLQGKIWEAGYRDGALQGVVFDDVPRAIALVNSRGGRVCIYSSGSIAAQRLLFGHSTAGDLTPRIAAYFDTTSGPKREQQSYVAIANALTAEPSTVLFCTDVPAEASAAAAAGMQTVILDRPGNAETEPHEFEVWSTLDPTESRF